MSQPSPEQTNEVEDVFFLCIPVYVKDSSPVRMKAWTSQRQVQAPECHTCQSENGHKRNFGSQKRFTCGGAASWRLLTILWATLQAGAGGRALIIGSLVCVHSYAPPMSAAALTTTTTTGTRGELPVSLKVAGYYSQEQATSAAMAFQTGKLWTTQFLRKHIVQDFECMMEARSHL